METTAPTRGAGARLPWPDVAKGLCILLVVLHHVTKYYAAHLPPDLVAAGTVWAAVSAGLKPVRMPLFFLISGWFAARAIHRPWGEHRRRLVGGFYLYAVWLLLYWPVYAVERTIDANRTDGPLDLLGELVWAATSMWFLYALVLYFVLARALRQLPPAVVLAAAASLSLCASWLPFEETNRVSVLFHFTYFALGAYLPRLVDRLAASPVPVRVLLPAFVLLSGVLQVLGVPRSVELVVLSLVGIPLGVRVAVRLGSGPVASLLGWLGRRTLRVYVLHMAVLAVVVHLPVPAFPAPALVVLPFAVTGAIVLACLVLHATLVRLGAGWLFEAPAWVVGRRAVPAMSVGSATALQAVRVDPLRRLW
ncbi:acyltransferase family protein [Nocardioides nanhaiensis]